jgi:hypothetical protein
MDQFRAVQDERLKQLSLASNKCMEVLKKKLVSAENMLKLAELCLNFETEQEKVLPFFSSHIHEDLQNLEEEQTQSNETLELTETVDESKPKLCSYAVDDKGQEVEEWDYLNRYEEVATWRYVILPTCMPKVNNTFPMFSRFFKRYNKALLDKASIDKERSRLKKENTDLRSILKQYLDGISVNDDVMNNPINPLVVVNNRLQVTLSERNKARTQVLTQRALTGQAPPQLVEVQAYAGGGIAN